MILGVSSLIRIAKVLAGPRPEGIHLSEMENIARSLALHGTFADPYLLPTGPTAHTAPGYPLLLGLIFLVFGTGVTGEVMNRIASAVVCSIQYALLPRVAVALALPRYTGAIAGLLAALAPYKGYVEGGRDSVDQPYVALALVLLFLHTCAVWNGKPISSLVRGLWWGLAALLSPVLGLVFAVVVAYEIAAMRQILKYRGLVPLVAAFLAIQVPWVLRNWVEMHAFVPSRSNFGLEFRISNGADSFSLAEDNVSHGVLARYHPGLSESEARRVVEQGEIAYNRAETTETLREIRRDPAHFVSLTVERIVRFWLAPSRRFKTTATATTITLVGLLGLWLLPPGPGVRLTWLILLTYPLVYYVVQVDARYTYPLAWIFITPAVHVVILAIRKIARRSS